METVTPVVLVPRFTTLVGPGHYLTLPLDVREYESARLTGWRGVEIGTSVQFFWVFLESTDRYVWDEASPSITPVPDEEELYEFDLTKRWFRIGMNLQGTNAGLTCWMQGFFINRRD